MIDSSFVPSNWWGSEMIAVVGVAVVFPVERRTGPRPWLAPSSVVCHFFDLVAPPDVLVMALSGF